MAALLLRALPACGLPACGAARRQEAPAGPCSTTQYTEVAAFAPAASGRCRPLRARRAAAAAAHPPPRPWPAGAYSPHRARVQRCSASADESGRAPDPQQQGAAAAGGSAAAGSSGGLEGAVRRSDSWVVQACRSIVGLLSNAWSFLASDLRGFLAMLLATAREMPPLLGQLHYPSPRLVAKRTAQVLGVVALLLAYVVAVDSLCSQIPRLIRLSQEHPGWLRRAAGGLVAAARVRLAGSG